MRVNRFQYAPTVMLLLILAWPASGFGGAFKYRIPHLGLASHHDITVVGIPRYHTIGPKDTLLDVARQYGLGFNEIQLAHPGVDPWVPRPGSRLLVPTQWVLPRSRYRGIVINIPELRLYRFFPEIGRVTTYPIAIGDIDWKTPRGEYRVVSRTPNPTWTIPKSLRGRYQKTHVPPGPDNPLGKYWIGLSIKGYGIHGTNFPWAIGRLVSHGCIRLYPEHIVRLFREVQVGTKVEIVYEPVKFGVRGGHVYIEVHPDLYGLIPDLRIFAQKRLKGSDFEGVVDTGDVIRALNNPTGFPIRVGSIPAKGGDPPMARDAVNRHHRIAYSTR